LLKYFCVTGSSSLIGLLLRGTKDPVGTLVPIALRGCILRLKNYKKKCKPAFAGRQAAKTLRCRENNKKPTLRLSVSAVQILPVSMCLCCFMHGDTWPFSGFEHFFIQKSEYSDFFRLEGHEN